MNDEDIKAEKEREMVKEIKQERREQEFWEWFELNEDSLMDSFCNEVYPDEFQEFAKDEFRMMKGD